MKIRTHRSANPRLLGKPVSLVDGIEATVELEASREMAVDELGLVHGGFTFGLADYAAMLAVNHPYVVLGASDVRFLAPVKVGDLMRARATASQREVRKVKVAVEVKVGERRVLGGQ